MSKDYKNRSFIKRLIFALNGLAEAWQEEKSFRTHIFLAVLTILVAFFLRVSFYDMVLIIISISSVLAAELINSVIEHTVDFLHPALDPKIKKIKDMAAAMVLIVSFGALLAGGIILLRNLSQRLS